MGKTAVIAEIEHKIEALQPADQLKLLERMVRHLKHAQEMPWPCEGY